MTRDGEQFIHGALTNPRLRTEEPEGPGTFKASRYLYIEVSEADMVKHGEAHIDDIVDNLFHYLSAEARDYLRVNLLTGKVMVE